MLISVYNILHAAALKTKAEAKLCIQLMLGVDVMTVMEAQVIQKEIEELLRVKINR